jgi:3-methyladenine DNA glycosylase AlkD
MNPIIAEIRELFRDAANPTDAGPMADYMKNIAPFFGVKAVPRRLIQKEVFRQYDALPAADWDRLLHNLYDQPERELHQMATDWLHHRRKTFTAGTITRIEWLITHHSWWDTVDTLASESLGEWAARFPDEAAPVMERFISSGNFWLNRSAIIHQLTYGNQTDTELLSRSIRPHLSSKEFFLRKAIGWALRQYARTNPDWVRNFVDTHPMSGLSKREALKHL